MADLSGPSTVRHTIYRCRTHHMVFMHAAIDTDIVGHTMSKVMAIRRDDSLVDKLERLSVALVCPQSWLIEQAIVSYVATGAGNRRSA